jgi:hypothetical protein
LVLFRTIYYYQVAFWFIGPYFRRQVMLIVSTTSQYDYASTYREFLCYVIMTVSTLFFSSPDLKAQVSYSDRLLSVVRLSVCLSVCKLLHFRILLQNHWSNFNQIWQKLSLGEGIQVWSNEGYCHSSRGDNSKRVKIHWKFLKIFFSRTSRPNSIKLGTHCPWVKEIQVCSNKGLGPLLRGDNHKNFKMGWDH